MARFEYSEWDGTQEFKPLSADSVFDALSEYLLNYGENVLRRFDELDPELLEFARPLDRLLCGPAAVGIDAEVCVGVLPQGADDLQIVGRTELDLVRFPARIAL